MTDSKFQSEVILMTDSKFQRGKNLEFGIWNLPFLLDRGRRSHSGSAQRSFAGRGLIPRTSFRSSRKLRRSRNSWIVMARARSAGMIEVACGLRSAMSSYLIAIRRPWESAKMSPPSGAWSSRMPVKTVPSVLATLQATNWGAISRLGARIDSIRRRRSVVEARVESSGPARPPRPSTWWQRKQPGPFE